MRGLILVAFLTTAIMPVGASEPDALRQALESRFPVEVLRLDSGQYDGRAIYVATVIQHPGNFNDALRVTQLMIDADTGSLIPQRWRAGTGTAYRPRREGMEAMHE